MDFPIADVATATRELAKDVTQEVAQATRDLAREVDPELARNLARDVTKRVRRAHQLIPPAALPRRFRRPAHRIHPAADAALVGLRMTLGSYMAGHGAQKLFGAFGGPGPDATGEHFEQIGLEPGRTMAIVAGSTELAGGALTALGLAYPLGPLALAGTMVVASGTAHRDHGAFAASGGPELPLTNLAAAFALAALGPGHLSIDELTGTRLPAPLARAIALAGVGVAAALVVRSVMKARAASTVVHDGDAHSSSNGSGRVGSHRDAQHSAV